MSRETIAFDIDDVLAASAVGWVVYSNKTWGTHLTMADYDEDWAKMWQVDFATARERAHQIHADPSIVGGFAPDIVAPAVLTRLSKWFDLTLATSRVRSHEEETLRWIDRHYKGIFSGLHLSDIYVPGNVSESAERMTKAALIESIGADYLVDDQLKHCLGVAATGRETVLFGDYTWNQAEELPTGVTRCKDWLEVEEFFNARR